MNNYCNIYTINNIDLNPIFFFNSEHLAFEKVQRNILRCHRYDVINKCAQNGHSRCLSCIQNMMTKASNLIIHKSILTLLIFNKTIQCMHLKALKRKPMPTYQFRSVTVFVKYMQLIIKRKHSILKGNVFGFFSKLSSCSF